MNKDQLKGTAKEMGGRAQEAAGDLTGSSEHKAKGMAKQAKGKAQQTVGDAKEILRDDSKSSTRR